MVALNLEAARQSILREILEEAAGRPLPELNENGWTQLGGGVDSLTGLDRAQVNADARRYYYTDPLARHLVRLINAYVFARGVSARAEDADVNAVVQRFWNHPLNRDTFTRAQAQWDLGREMQLDGEVFFALYTSTLTGRVTVRTIPAAEIASIEYASGDNRMPMYFVRKYMTPNGQTIEQRIPDFRIWGDQPVGIPPNTEIAIMHAMSNELAGRGLSELSTVIPWIKALKGFMEDRATLSLALATFAFKLKIKGNRQAAERIAAQMTAYDSDAASKYGGDGKERRQGAGTAIENESSNLEQMKVDSGAPNAYQDMRMFRQQAGIGTGIFEHYMGDPSTGNLATATAMELPMLKMFEFAQAFWGDMIGDILGFSVRQDIRYGKLVKGIAEVDSTGGIPVWVVEPKGNADLSTQAIFPPIVQSDLAVWSTAISQIKMAEASTGTQIVPPEQTAMAALNIMGFANEAGQIVAGMRENNFALAQPVPSQITPEKGTYMSQNPNPSSEPSTTEESLAEAENKALPPKEATKVPKITKSEMDKAFDDFLAMPSLEEMAKELGMTLEELDNA